MISIKKSGLRALLITLFTMLIISSLVVLVKAKNNNSEVKEVEKTTVLAPQWFEYIGPAASDPNYDPHNPDNYRAVDSPSGPTCVGDQQVCGINVTPDSNSDPNNPIPSLSELLLLTSAINDKQPIDNTLVFRNE